MTETQSLVLPAGTYQESGGQVVMESENGQRATGLTHQWLTATAQSGYTGTAYLQTSLDVDQLYQTSQITSSPRAEYSIQLTTPGTYTVWVRGYPANAAGDSVYVGTKNQMVGVTGFAPGQWSWAKLNLSNGAAATLPLTTTGLITMGLWMREDGLQIDRVLLTTNTTYIPTGFGPAESSRIATQTTLSTTITRTIVYTYDDLYRLTNANYSTGELFAYTYDPAGNRKSQTTLAGTNVYTYDAANRLTQVDGIAYSWDNNGNLLSDGQRTFTYDSANRLTSVVNAGVNTQYTYNGDGDRLAQIVAGVTTKYALDPTGLAQVLIETTSGQSTHYLPGLAQYGSNAWSYYLPDRLGSVRQLTDSGGAVTLARSYDPFGNVLEQTGVGQSVFGYTGEQTDPTGLVFLRARYYSPGVGRFLTADSVVPDPLRSGGWNRYAYVENNPLRYTDPSGYCIVQYSGAVRMSQAPYGTSGLCPHTESPGIWDIEDINHPSGKGAFGMPSRPPVNQPLATGLGVTALVVDTYSFIISAFAAGTAYSAALATSETGGVAGYATADAAYALSGGILENVLGLISFGITATGDFCAGNTYPTDEGLIVGQDTYISLILTIAGTASNEVTIDLAINFIAVAYDANSIMNHPGITGNLPGNMFLSKYWIAPRVPPRPQQD